MSHDEMECAIDFILRQQGRFEAIVQTKIEAILDQKATNASHIMQFRSLGAKLARSQLRTDKQLAATNRQLAGTDRRIDPGSDRADVRRQRPREESRVRP